MKKFNIKNRIILPVLTFLSFGMLAGASFSYNATQSQQEIKKADAALYDWTGDVDYDSSLGVLPSPLYIAVTSKFAYGSSSYGTIYNCKLAITTASGGTLGGGNKDDYKDVSTLVSNYSSIFEMIYNTDSHNGFDILVIKSPNDRVASFKMRDNTGNSNWAHNVTEGMVNAEDFDIDVPRTVNGVVNYFVMNTDHGCVGWPHKGETLQHGGWGCYAQKTTIASRKTLYFNICNYWASSTDTGLGYTGAWPYIMATLDDGSTYNRVASGFTAQGQGLDIHSCTSSNRERWYVFYFVDVPMNISSIVIYKDFYHSPNASTSSDATKYKCTFSSGQIDDWNDGKYNLIHNTNINGTTSVITDGGTYSFPDESRSYLIGTLGGTDNVEAMATDNEIAKNLTLQPVVEKTSGSLQTVYSTRITVSKDEYFKFRAFDYIVNNSTSSLTQINVVGDSNEYNISNIIVKVGNNVVDTSSYVTNTTVGGSSTWIKFLRSGTVNFVRYAVGNDFNTDRGESKVMLYLIYDPDYSIGTYYNNSSSVVTGLSDPYDYDVTSGYAIIGGLARTKFTLNDSQGALFTFSSSELDNRTSGKVTCADSVFTVVTLGYYKIGWNSYGSNGDGIRVYIEPYTTYSDVSCVNALAHTIKALNTCACNDNANDLKSLYDTCTYSGKDNYLKTDATNCVFDDYDYAAYRMNNKSYTGLSKTHETNAHVKYTWIQYLANKDNLDPTTRLPYPYSHGAGSLTDNVVYQESNNALVIIVAVISGVSIISLALVNFLVIKKRKTNRSK